MKPGLGRWFIPSLGLLGTLLSWVAIAVAGDTPDPHETPATIGAYFIEHRTRILGAAPAGYLGAVAIAGFVFALAGQIRALDQHIAAVLTMLGGAFAAAYLAML